MSADETVRTRPAWGRSLPTVTDEAEAFWHGGERGELVLRKCTTCGALQHPPGPACRKCRGVSFENVALSGRATVATFTVNRQAWFPDLELPYVVAIVELDEDPTVRLTTALVDCAPESVRIGMPVSVAFRQFEDVWLPLFRPAEVA